MFRVENYVLLYISEYVGYIFDNIDSMYKLSKKAKEEVKNSLLKEIRKSINIYVHKFKPNINKESVTKMTETANEIAKYDANHKINFYEIFLDNGKIQISGDDNCLIMSFYVDGVVINQCFDLKNYCKVKDFNVSLEAYTKDYEQYYVTLEDGKVLVYDRDTIMTKFITRLSSNSFIHPNSTFVVGSEQEWGFFEYLKKFCESEKKKEKSKIKIRWYY